MSSIRVEELIEEFDWFDGVYKRDEMEEAPEYVRASAVEALTSAVARGAASREEVIAFLSGLFTGAEAKADSFFWSNVVCAISDLHPEEAMAVIRKAFEDDLVNPGYVGLNNVEADLSRGREEMLGELRAMVDHRIPPDVHG